jgi:integrase
MRRPNAELRTREHLTTQEGEALIEAAGANRQGHRDALMILLAFRHGLRASEVCDLRWEQIDFKAATLHVRRTKPRIVVNGMDRPRSRPDGTQSAPGALSGEGAPSCVARPPFTQ